MNQNIFARFEKHADKTFAQAAERYLSEFQGKDKGRVNAALQATLPYIGKMLLIDVDDEAMADFKRDRANGTGHFDRPAMAGTTNKELTQVVTVLNRACRVWRWLPSAPQLCHVTGSARHGYPLSREEQDRLFGQLPTGFDVGVACFAVNTGVRKEELFGLKWTDLVAVPEIGPDIFVAVLHDTKNGKDRAVICNSIARRCVEIERKWQAKHGASDYVFPRKRCPSSNGKTWITAWTKAGMPPDPLIKRGIHNLRHTFAHRLRAAGVPEEDRNSLLGHNNHSLAQHYAMPDIRRLLDAAELVTERRETTVIRSAHHSDRGTVHPKSQ